MIACGAVLVFSIAETLYIMTVMHEPGSSSLHTQWARWLDGALLVAPVPLGGLLGDRFPIRRAMFVFGLVESLSMAVLAISTTLPMFLLATALSGIGVGGGLPLTYAALGVYFGRRNFATIAGLSLLLLQTAGVGAAILAAMGISKLHELTGSHTLPLVAIGLVSAAGSLGFLSLGDPRPFPSQDSRHGPPEGPREDRWFSEVHLDEGRRRVIGHPESGWRVVDRRGLNFPC